MTNEHGDAGKPPLLEQLEALATRSPKMRELGAHLTVGLAYEDWDRIIAALKEKDARETAQVAFRPAPEDAP